jgi:hypothetical protein
MAGVKALPPRDPSGALRPPLPEPPYPSPSRAARPTLRPAPASSQQASCAGTRKIQDQGLWQPSPPAPLPRAGEGGQTPPTVSGSRAAVRLGPAAPAPTRRGDEGRGLAPSGTAVHAQGPGGAAPCRSGCVPSRLGRWHGCEAILAWQGRAGICTVLGQAGRVSTPSRAGRVSTPSQAGRVSTPSQAGRVSTPSQAGRVSAAEQLLCLAGR